MKYGRLTFLKSYRRPKDNRVVWECICECGNIHVALKTSILRAWSKLTGRPESTISNRLNRGLTAKEAVMAPLSRKRNRRKS